jgi:peptidoglycan/xylan/chitin deacetylase (PgdA/CDA1 family)
MADRREMRRQRRRLRLLLILLVAAAVLSYLLHEQIIRGVFSPLVRGVIYRVETDRKAVSLTFDVVWMPAETGRILDILDRYQLTATFFLTGNWVRRNPDLAREIILRGHEIGQHTFSHHRLPELNDNELVREFEQMEKALRDELNVTTELFRPPYGEIDERVRDFAAARGYTTVLWSIDPHDWLNPGEELLTGTVIQKAHPGAIILLHTSAGQLPEALPAIIEGLKAKGFEMLPLSALLAESRKVGAD